MQWPVLGFKNDWEQGMLVLLVVIIVVCVVWCVCVCVCVVDREIANELR